jgi:hypothetical protein
MLSPGLKNSVGLDGLLVHGQRDENAASSLLRGMVPTLGVRSWSSSAAMSSSTKQLNFLESHSFETAAHSSRQSFRLRSGMFLPPLLHRNRAVSRFAARKLSHFQASTGR